MKTSKKIIGIILVIFLPLASVYSTPEKWFSPNDKIILTVFPSEGIKSINVVIANLKHNKTSIKICDEKGWVVFRMGFKNKIGFASKFDLSKLSGKDYSISVVQKGIVFSQHFSLSETGPVMGRLEKWCLGKRTILKEKPLTKEIAKVKQ